MSGDVALDLLRKIVQQKVVHIVDIFEHHDKPTMFVEPGGPVTFSPTGDQSCSFDATEAERALLVSLAKEARS